MIYLIIGLILLTALLTLGNKFVNANPANLARGLRLFGGAFLMVLALVFALTGLVVLTGLWTKAMMTDGFPELQKVYGLYGKKENVICTDLTHFRHNYNYVSRGLMYNWFNHHMAWGHKAPIVEQDFKLLSKEEHAVWNDKHPKPKGGDAFERKLTRQLADQDSKLLDAMSDKERRVTVRAAWKIMIGRGLPAAADIKFENGKLSFPVSEVTIASNPKAMFKRMTLANDIDRKFSIAAPTIAVEGMTLAGE